MKKSKQKKIKLSRARQHTLEQRKKREQIVSEVAAKLKRAKKGKKHMAAEMEKEGYLPDKKGGWRRMTDKERNERTTPEAITKS